MMSRPGPSHRMPIMERTSEPSYTAAVRRPRTWLRRLGLGILALAVLGAIGWWLRPGPRLDCKAASSTAGDGLAVTVCQGEYERTRDPSTGADLAGALYLSGNLQAAEALAKDLI